MHICCNKRFIKNDSWIYLWTKFASKTDTGLFWQGSITFWVKLHILHNPNQSYPFTEIAQKIFFRERLPVDSGLLSRKKCFRLFHFCNSLNVSHDSLFAPTKTKIPITSLVISPNHNVLMFPNLKCFYLFQTSSTNYLP